MLKYVAPTSSLGAVHIHMCSEIILNTFSCLVETRACNAFIIWWKTINVKTTFLKIIYTGLCTPCSVSCMNLL